MIYCVECQMEYKRGDHQMILPCKHIYCSCCVSKWLSINKACPVCFAEVFTEEPSDKTILLWFGGCRRLVQTALEGLEDSRCIKMTENSVGSTMLGSFISDISMFWFLWFKLRDITCMNILYV